MGRKRQPSRRPGDQSRDGTGDDVVFSERTDALLPFSSLTGEVFLFIKPFCPAVIQALGDAVEAVFTVQDVQDAKEMAETKLDPP
jgi:hypothetical protein